MRTLDVTKLTWLKLSTVCPLTFGRMYRFSATNALCLSQNLYTGCRLDIRSHEIPGQQRENILFQVGSTFSTLSSQNATRFQRATYVLPALYFVLGFKRM